MVTVTLGRTDIFAALLPAGKVQSLAVSHLARRKQGVGLIRKTKNGLTPGDQAKGSSFLGVEIRDHHPRVRHFQMDVHCSLIVILAF